MKGETVGGDDERDRDRQKPMVIDLESSFMQSYCLVNCSIVLLSAATTIVILDVFHLSRD